MGNCIQISSGWWNNVSFCINEWVQSQFNHYLPFLILIVMKIWNLSTCRVSPINNPLKKRFAPWKTKEIESLFGRSIFVAPQQPKARGFCQLIHYTLSLLTCSWGLLFKKLFSPLMHAEKNCQEPPRHGLARTINIFDKQNSTHSTQEQTVLQRLYTNYFFIKTWLWLIVVYLLFFGMRYLVSGKGNLFFSCAK